MQCYNGKSCPSYNDRDILFGGGWVGFCNGSNMQGEANTICWVTNESCQAFFFFFFFFFNLNVGNLSKEEHFGLAFSW